MADWSKPALGDLYENFLQYLKDRDVDLATMFAAPATNVPVGAVRWNDTNKRLEKWSGSAWTVLPIGVTGGGTGATTVATARSALGAAAEADLSGHTGTQSGVHGSTNTPTANRLPQYDASGRLKSNAPAASNDVVRKAETDDLSTALSAHSGAASPHSGHATSADLAAHSGNTSNPHGVTAAQVGAAPSGRTITAGNGLTGGGDLSGDRSLALGTPSMLSGSTSNGTTAGSHTHALSMASQAQAEAGADSSVLMSPLRTRQAIDARIGAKTYKSPAQVITSAGTLTLAHGLGVLPRTVTTYLQCVAAQWDYSIGDIISNLQGADANHANCVILPTSTSLIVRFGSSITVFRTLHKTNGQLVSLTNANWRLIVVATV